MDEYFKELEQYPKCLERDDELELFKRYRAGDENAGHIIVTSNLRLVLHIANKYSRLGHTLLEDRVAVGNIGLVMALQHFDSARGVRFSTYACKCIASAIIDYSYDRLIRIPKHIKDKLRVHFKADSVPEHGTTAYDGFKAINYTVEIEDVEEPKCENPIELDDDIAAMYKHIDRLPPRYAEVIRCRYWYGWTLDQVGAKLGVTCERVRQIQKAAVAKLKEKLRAQD